MKSKYFLLLDIFFCVIIHHHNANVQSKFTKNASASLVQVTLGWHFGQKCGRQHLYLFIYLFIY